jgi:aspartate ammonia-lyase
MIEIMANALHQVTTKCFAGIEANPDRCREYAEKTLGTATALTGHLGYARAAEIAREAQKTGKTIRQLILEKKLLSPKKVDQALDLERLANPHPRKPGKA